jgi:hypothetical protein
LQGRNLILAVENRVIKARALVLLQAAQVEPLTGVDQLLAVRGRSAGKDWSENREVCGRV